MTIPPARHQAAGARYLACIEEESDKAKVVAAGWGTYLNTAVAFRSKDDLKKRFFFEEHPFWEGGGLVWCEPWMIVIIFPKHPFRSSMHPFLQIILVLKL